MSSAKLVWKLKRKSERLSSYLVCKAQARVRPTYLDKDWKHWDKLRLSPPPICPGSYDKAISWAEEVLKHTFDLLGSGKVKVHYGLDAKGFEEYKYPPLKMDFQFDDKGKWLAKFINKTNLSYSQKVWRFLRSINPSYEPIDWQLDFKSGYRWDNDTFYMDIRYGHKLGADVKVPWQLSRFQHLSALAIAYKITGDEKYALEYVSEILDWIATNPTMFGVNWKCTMDVAIRVANWLFWFGCIKDWVDRQEWKEEFYRIFLNSLYDHLRFIPKNLEWSPTLTTNHYLSDIAGLLILVSSTEGVFPESKRLRRFAIEELKKEMFKQVYPDGTDFEASTCYHRLVLEIFFYPVWWEVVHHRRFNGENYREVAEEIFGKSFVDRLYQMFDAVLYLLKPNGRMPQIGDNDNGQFIKLYPREVLDMWYLLALGGVFFREPRFKVKEFFQTEEDIAEVKILYGEKGLEIWNDLGSNKLEDVKSKGFPDSGWYVMRDGLNYCIVSCGPNGQSGNGGHAHNDKLGFELSCYGENWLVDPGTFVYTTHYQERNLFRSTSFHSVVMVDGAEINQMDERRLFSLQEDASPTVKDWYISSEADRLVAQHSGYERLRSPLVHRRSFTLVKAVPLFLVWDHLYGSGLHSVDIFFHFGPFICVDSVMSPNIRLRSSRLADVKLFLVAARFPPGLTVDIEEGWISQAYGCRYKAPVARFRVEGKMPMDLLWAIRPFQGALKPSTDEVKSSVDHWANRVFFSEDHNQCAFCTL